MTDPNGPASDNSVQDYPIHAAATAAIAGDIAAITALRADSPADLELQDTDLHTPLLLAVYANKPDVVRALLEAGADASTNEGEWGNSTIRQKYDVISTAVVFGCEAALEILLEEKWDVFQTWLSWRLPVWAATKPSAPSSSTCRRKERRFQTQVYSKVSEQPWRRRRDADITRLYTCFCMKLKAFQTSRKMKIAWHFSVVLGAP